MAVSCLSLVGKADSVTQDSNSDAVRVVSKHKAAFTAFPKNTPSQVSVDAPLLGNGDVGVCIGGKSDNHIFWLAKNDFWRLKSHIGYGAPSPVGTIQVGIPALKNAKYHVEQDLSQAMTEVRVENSKTRVEIESFVAATSNMLVLKIRLEGEPTSISISSDTRNSGYNSKIDAGVEGGITWKQRRFSGDVDLPTSCAFAMRVDGAQQQEQFLLAPGKEVTVLVGLKSSFESENSVAECIRMVAEADVFDLLQQHRAWWSDYWSKSYVQLPDAELEKMYYLSLYVTGSCSRNPEFPPGIFGTWITKDKPRWNGDYHLNYNHFAPFYALYSANRIEQADPHHAPLLDFMEKGKRYAKEELGCRGIYYPVGCGPKACETGRYGTYDQKGDSSPGLFCGQKSNASYGLVNTVNRWHYTYDVEFAKKLYPYVREVASFWEDYLTWDQAGNRYVSEDDACHERSWGDVNPILSLAFIPMCMELAIDMSSALGIGSGRHEKWQHIIDHISEFSTQIQDGKEIYRLTEKGMALHHKMRNTVLIQHIYPGGRVHLGSSPEQLRLGLNTIDFLKRWHDKNGSNSFFPAAVRVGYDPNVILEELHTYCRNAQPNGFEKDNPHGIENCSTVPNTINEMLCMSHAGVIRPFVAWPRSMDARFTRIRAWGAFLVSSELKEGQVRFVEIESEKGKECRVVNPWPGKEVAVLRNGVAAGRVSGAEILLQTKPGERIRLSAAQ